MAKTTKKVIRQYELVRSDRIELVQQANTLVASIIHKQTSPLFADKFAAQELPVSDMEQLAYNAALGFLSRQFDAGFKEPEPFENRLETEEITEG